MDDKTKKIADLTRSLLVEIGEDQIVKVIEDSLEII